VALSDLPSAGEFRAHPTRYAVACVDRALAIVAQDVEDEGITDDDTAELAACIALTCFALAVHAADSLAIIADKVSGRS
jgi:hypothetical protein